MANKVAYGRRTSADPKWAETKKLVDARDKRQCRLMMCLSITESKQLRAESEKTLDRCHIFAASAHPDLIYNVNNIVTLTRFIHRRMDNFKHPLSGENIPPNENFYWWHRILTKSIEKYNEELDYEQLLIAKIK
jgi:hypothetical protein